MNSSKSFGIVLIAVALLSAGLLAGCGSGSDETSDTATSASAEGVPARSESSSEFEPGPLSIPDEGPAKYRIPGYREDVPGFGEEGSEQELTQAATYVHGYGVGRLEKNWAKACSYASETLVRRLAKRAKLPPSASCEEALETVPDIVLGSDYERTSVEADSLRVEGKQGYLIYSAAEMPYFMPVIEEGGIWKVNSRAGTPFYYSEN